MDGEKPTVFDRRLSWIFVGSKKGWKLNHVFVQSIFVVFFPNGRESEFPLTTPVEYPNRLPALVRLQQIRKAVSLYFRRFFIPRQTWGHISSVEGIPLVVAELSNIVRPHQNALWARDSPPIPGIHENRGDG